MATRRLRAFKRWMKDHGVECSDALYLVDESHEGISVRALCDLKEGDVVANIPKTSCLTIKTSGACEIIESAGLDGCLGLSVALMYELSLGEKSPWAGYLQLLPFQEDLPLLWSLHDLDSLLCGTELHKVVKEDKALIYEDWKESILPLMDSSLQNVDPKFFGIEAYFAAKSLIASRSFEIDDYHGFGMVPLADLFNHKTGAEDVHFTSESSLGESDNEAENVDFVMENINEDECSTQSSSSAEQALDELPGETTNGGADEDDSLELGNDSPVLEMIMVKDVPIGAEVYNTYGTLGNAALLHRYGFTELDNPYDIVNIDLELVFEWGSSTFSSRYTRARLALWRKLGYTGCVSQNSEYFEISSNGEPQIELLILLYILLLPEDTYNNLDLAASTAGDADGLVHATSFGKHSKITFSKTSGIISKDLLLTSSVSKALLEIADKRESIYGLRSFEDEVDRLKNCCSTRERRLYHSLILRVSERKVLEKFRKYADRRGKKISIRKRQRQSNSTSL